MTDAAAPPPPDTSSHRRDRPRTGRRVVGGVVLLLCLLGLAAPMPVYVVSPGPVFPLGQAVHVEGTEPVNGDFLFTTVQLEDATLADTLRAAVDADRHVVARIAVLGSQSEEEFIAEQEQLFAEAEALAVRLGLAQGDRDVAATAVTVESEGVGGPSAGLLIALAVADLASTADLAAGRLIAGTGTVEEDGSVGVVGSVTDKVEAAERAGAQLFLVASSQVEEARAAAVIMPVVGVATLSEAVAALAG